MKRNGFMTTIDGSYEEAGVAQANFVKLVPPLWDVCFHEREVEESWYHEQRAMLGEYNQGVLIELDAFCEELKMSPKQLVYLEQTCMQSGCSHAVFLPSTTKTADTYVVRTYEFHPEIDDLRLCSTRIQGAYAHTGFSIQLFGRCEGMNEHGLCVTFSACGMPVGILEGLRKPKAKGLQSWAVVRTLLETCKTVKEAEELLKAMPIAANMNLIVADCNKQALLFETMDGKKAMKSIEDRSDTSYLVATNHVLFDKLLPHTSGQLKNSVKRHSLLTSFVQEQEKVTIEKVKSLAQVEYPEGLAVHYYQEYFGTLRALVFHLEARRIEVCFGAPTHNSWNTYKVGESLPDAEVPITWTEKVAPGDFWECE
ncbi:C45 family autoproteolytic acyltransferase/hydolase [Brevibacillus daliensis]|uniref:C45 family autoproteolytic acyltransferase/hydolase n=1 Tax=Brevibacillus daliensis TaxID=2892995 RepID=UPI001E490749|nr:C45 family peptidase [Brevibacillus daliensis]